MAYTGGHNARRDRIDLSLVVAEMLSILKSTVAPNATIRADLASDLPEIRANITEIRQVVLNLVMNASESLQRHEGTIRVTTERVTVGRNTTSVGGTCTPGEYCRLVVSDTGCGMPPEVRARVFDPFYTTKCIGRGLGLSVVQGIVNSLGGSINCATLPGEGSTFEVMVPCASYNSVQAEHFAMSPANC